MDCVLAIIMQMLRIDRVVVVCVSRLGLVIICEFEFNFEPEMRNERRGFNFDPGFQFNFYINSLLAASVKATDEARRILFQFRLPLQLQILTPPNPPHLIPTHTHSEASEWGSNRLDRVNTACVCVCVVVDYCQAIIH